MMAFKWPAALTSASSSGIGWSPRWRLLRMLELPLLRDDATACGLDPVLFTSLYLLGPVHDPPVHVHDVVVVLVDISDRAENLVHRQAQDGCDERVVPAVHMVIEDVENGDAGALDLRAAAAVVDFGVHSSASRFIVSDAKRPHIRLLANEGG